MKRKNFTDANREAWDEAAPLHRGQNMESLLAAFRTPGYSCLDEIETERIQALGVAGKDVAQLCCNNGRELLSVKNMGAARCVGFDGAKGFIEQAREANAMLCRGCANFTARHSCAGFSLILPGPRTISKRASDR